MLPTLGFVLAAYLLYALYRAWSRHHRRQFRPYSRYRWKGRTVLVGGTGVGLGAVILISILGLPAPEENLRTAGFISASWGHEAWRSDPGMQRQEILPTKNQSDPGHPAYAYLHPETPAAQLPPEQTAPGPRRLQKPSLRKPVPQGKALKTIARVPPKKDKPSKDKASNKTRAKKKKSNAPVAKLAANAG